MIPFADMIKNKTLETYTDSPEELEVYLVSNEEGDVEQLMEEEEYEELGDYNYFMYLEKDED